MSQQLIKIIIIAASNIIVLMSLLLPNVAVSDRQRVTTGNFGLPGVIDLPTALRFPDGELAITQQLHKTLARSGISFQALPRVGVSFRYTGHGNDGEEAYNRYNHDRSFDAHISVLDEQTYIAISVGLRDFIGTDGIRLEYIVGTKSFRNFEFTGGLGLVVSRGEMPFLILLAHCHLDLKIGKRIEKQATEVGL